MLVRFKDTTAATGAQLSVYELLIRHEYKPTRQLLFTRKLDCATFIRFGDIAFRWWWARSHLAGLRGEPWSCGEGHYGDSGAFGNRRTRVRD